MSERSNGSNGRGEGSTRSRGTTRSRGVSEVGSGAGKVSARATLSARLLLLTGCAALALGCSSKSKPDPYGNYDVGTQALVLFPAPGQLCEGDGTKKECSTPGGCAPPSSGGTTGSGNPGAGLGSGTSASPSGGGSAADFSGSEAIFTEQPSFGGDAPPGPAEMDDSEPEVGPLPVDPGGVPDTPETLPDAGAAGAGLPPLAEAGAPLGDASAPLTGTGSDAGAAMSRLDAGSAGDAGSDTASNARADAGAPALGTRRLQQIERDLEQACALADDGKAAKLYLSADDSNSTAAPVIARRMINARQAVPASIIRPYEFLNYYDFAFEPARAEEVRIVPQLSSCPVNNQLNLQVALQAERRHPTDRRPLNLTVVLDTSGSMVGGPTWLAQAALRAMAGQFQAGDLFSLIFWNEVQDVRLLGHEVSGPNDAAILEQIDLIVPAGGTNLSAGLAKGYEVASLNQSDERINRVIMISDGGANVGVTDATLIGSYANDEDGEEGIYLAGIGVGDGYNDQLMNSVTDAGRGAYVYLDSPEEADRMLGERFLEVVDVAARGVRLELTLPWYMQVTKFFGEQISIDPNQVKPQHLAPNSAMVFFQVLEACDPSLIDGDDRIQLRATWTTPLSRQKREATINTTLNDLAGEDGEIEKAAVIAGYAEALATVYGMTSVEGLEVLQRAYDDVMAAPRAAEDPDLIEIAGLLRLYATRYGTLREEPAAPVEAVAAE